MTSKVVYIDDNGTKKPVYVVESNVPKILTVTKPPTIERSALFGRDRIYYWGPLMYDGPIFGPIATYTDATGEQQILSFWARTVNRSGTLLSYWREWDSDSTEPTIFAADGGAHAGMSVTGWFYFYNYNSNGIEANWPQVLNPGGSGWHHVMLSYNVGTTNQTICRLWVDGTLSVYSYNPQTNVRAPATPDTTRVGYENNGTNDGMGMCCAGVWKFPAGSNLSEEDMTKMAEALYNSGVGLQYSDMLFNGSADLRLGNLKNFYNLCEASDGSANVIRYDSVGEKDLYSVAGSGGGYTLSSDSFPGM